MGKNDVQIGVLLDIGDVKKTNQDSVLNKFARTNSGDVGLFIVADGMGGLAYGEEISNLVVTYFNRWWDEFFYPYVNDEKCDLRNVDQMLEAAIIEINNQAIQFSRQVDKKAGSTLSLLLLIKNRYFIKNIGDSRVYVIRKNKKIKLTKDQSLVAQMVRNGEITEEEAKHHSRKNVLTMCLGVFEEIKTFSAGGQVMAGDVFLLCSDGFYNYVNEERVLPIIIDAHYQDLNQKAAALRSAIANGNARDNVSIILVKLGSRYKLRLVSLIILILILMTVGGVLAFYYWKDSSYLKYIVELVGAIWK